VKNEDWSPWGLAWADAYYMTQPNEIGALMRDGLGMGIQEIAVAKVLVAFRERATPNEYVVWSSLDTIADRAGMSKDAAGRAIRSMLKSGVLVEAEERRPCRGHARRYDLHPMLTRLAELRPADVRQRTKKEDK
jgi:hypothetical protein